MSLFTKYINLRDELADRAYNNNLFATIAAGVSPGSSFSGEIDSVSGAFNSNNDTLTLTNGRTSESVSYGINQIQDHLADVIPSSGLRVSDWLSTVSKSGDLYVTLSNITAKFSYCSRMTLTDINMLIDNSVAQYGNINYDTDDLKQQLVSMSDNDGFVTSRSWLLSLNNWFKNAETAAQSGSPEMDTTKPFTLTSVYNIIVSGLMTAISSILSAMRTIFTAILAIVSTVISVIFQQLNQISQGVTVDHNASNCFVKGPISYIERGILPVYSANEYKVFSYSKNGITSFFWNNGDFTKYRINSYLTPTYTTENVNVWLEQNHWSRASLQSNGNWLIYPGIADAPEIADGNETLFEYDNFRFFAAIAMDFLVRVIQITSTCANTIGSGLHAGLVQTPSMTVYREYARLAGLATRMLTNCRRGYAYNNGINFNDLEQAVHDYIQLITNQAGDDSLVFGPVNTSSSYSYTFTSSHHDDYHSDDIYMFTPKYSMMNAPFAKLVYDNAASNYYYSADAQTYNDRFECNSLPTVFMYSMDSITNQALITAAWVTAGITIASTVIYLKASRACRLKKIRKSITRSANIADAKAAYDRNPTKSNLDNYAAEVDKYNRLGQIFGWGSYDARNAWINDVDKGNSEPSTVPFINAIRNTADSSNTQLQSLTDSESGVIAVIQSLYTNVMQKLNDISGLIK